MRKLLVLSALILTSCAGKPTMATETHHKPKLCMDIAQPKDAILAQNGRWIELTPEQWQFLRGVYIMNPNTPPGMPFGDKAVLAQGPNDEDGVIFFIDGGRACTPISVTAPLIELLQDVDKSSIPHEPGNGL